MRDSWATEFPAFKGSDGHEHPSHVSKFLDDWRVFSQRALFHKQTNYPSPHRGNFSTCPNMDGKIGGYTFLASQERAALEWNKLCSGFFVRLVDDH